jgi:hypothetical protein
VRGRNFAQGSGARDIFAQLVHKKARTEKGFGAREILAEATHNFCV